jgi:hypothetical protein
VTESDVDDQYALLSASETWSVGWLRDDVAPDCESVIVGSSGHTSENGSESVLRAYLCPDFDHGEET